MPTLVVDTNLPQDKLTADAAAKLHAAVAAALGKPPSYVCVQLSGGKTMNFGGSTDPCALLTLGSIGQISTEKNKATSAALAKVLEAELGISSSRAYIEFKNYDKANVGFQGTTFDDLL